MAQAQAEVIMVDTDSDPEEMDSTIEAEILCGAAADGTQTSTSPDLLSKNRSSPDIISVSSMEDMPCASPLRQNAMMPFRYRTDAISLSSMEEIIHAATPVTLSSNGVVSPETENSDDVIFVSSVEELHPPKLSKGNIAYEVYYNGKNIEEICICCGGLEIHNQHPLFHGGICAPCTIEEWGPFDFIFGSTPPVAKSYNHPSACYFYQYMRILQYTKPPEGSHKPFFWLFVDNLVLDEETRDTASRFFQMEAVLTYKRSDDIIQNAAHIWSNIPSVNSKYSAASSYVDLSLLAKKILRTRIFSQRPATIISEFFVPLKDYFRAFS